MPQNAPVDGGQDMLIARIGYLTRLLRDSMHELGLDKAIEEAAQAVPDARDRLRYVVRMTEQAATTVLAATEKATPIQDDLAKQSLALKALVDQHIENHPTPSPIMGQVQQFLGDVPNRTGQTNELLMQIMMAQGFQDLTGQVIMKMMELIGVIEKELIQVLLQGVSPDKRKEAEGLLNGPQIDVSAPDVVASQDQVDDLLDSLGF